MFELVIGRYDMGNKKSTFRLILTVSVLAICGVVAFVIVQSWMKGRISEPELFDLSAIQSNIHDNQRRALKPIADEPYHYDFFTLLDQPIADRDIPEIDLGQNPALKARQRHALDRLSGKFAIQVASLQSANDAQTLVRQLNVQGYHAVIFNDSVNGATWYRVRIDGGISREQAETLQATIEKKTGLKGFVVSL